MHRSQPSRFRFCNIAVITEMKRNESARSWSATTCPKHLYVTHVSSRQQRAAGGTHEDDGMIAGAVTMTCELALRCGGTRDDMLTLYSDCETNVR